MLSKFSVKRPHLIIVGILVILILGATSLRGTTTSLLPEIDVPYVAVATTVPGASPQQVEREVTTPIEDALSSTSGLDTITSTSSESFSIVLLAMTDDTDLNTAMTDVRETLDLTEADLPDIAGTPTLLKFDVNSLPTNIIAVSIDGMDREDASSYIEDEIIPQFERINSVASVSVDGIASPEVNVILSGDKVADINKDSSYKIAEYTTRKSLEDSEVPADQLDAQMKSLEEDGSIQESADAIGDIITTDMVADILKGQNFDYPNGYVAEDGFEYLVRTGDAFSSIDQIATTPLYVNADADVRINLSDVADVAIADGTKESYTKVDGENAVLLSLQKQSKSTTSEIANDISQVEDDITASNSNVTFLSLSDQGQVVDFMVTSVTNNLLFGTLFAILVLIVFFRNVKLTAIVGISIPLSLFVALVIMYYMDITINLMSLSGLALGVGLLVDNSIVVIENIYRVWREEGNATQAAIKGAKQVGGAIIASTITTCAVFIPFSFTTGLTRQLFTDLSLTIVFSLLASLLVALTVVPMASAYALKHTSKPKTHKTLDHIKDLYERLLENALNHKAIYLFLIAIVFGGTIYGVTQMGTEFIPETDTGQITANIQFEPHTNFDERADELADLTEIMSETSGVDSIGVSYSRSTDLSSVSAGGQGDSSGATMYLVLDEERDDSASEIAATVLRKAEDAGFTLSVSSGSFDISALTGSGISYTLRGQSLDTLKDLSTQVSEIMEGTEGTVDIDTGITDPSTDFKVTVDKEKAVENGLTVAQVYEAISNEIPLKESVTTLTTDMDDYPVYVNNDIDVEPTLDDIRELTIKNNSGEMIAITDVATLAEADGFSSIDHENRERTLTVSCGLADDYNVGKVGSVISDKVDGIDVPAGYSIASSGEDFAINDALGDLGLVMVLAILLVYLVMVAQFRSWRYPLVIMFTLPLAYMGGIIALLITGLNLSIVGAVGFVMLTGIVVNNGIVFVDYANQLRREGTDTRSALIETGRLRLRPIVMTALTTIFAMIMLALGRGQGSEMSQPMAVVVIGGLSLATVLTLVIVPIMYELITSKPKAAVKTAPLNWNEMWNKRLESRGPIKDADYWDSRSNSYEEYRSDQDEYPERFLEAAGIKPNETVIDFGCGTGTLSIPLARDDHHVWAGDFSPIALEKLNAYALAHGLDDKITTFNASWHDDWRALNVPTTDVVIASRSIMVPDLEKTLRQMDDMASRRVCLTVSTQSYPSRGAEIMEAIGRIPDDTGDYLLVLNQLHAMGIDAELRMIPAIKKDHFKTRDEACQHALRALGNVTEQELAALQPFLDAHIRPRQTPKGTVWERDWSGNCMWAFISWNK